MKTVIITGAAHGVGKAIANILKDNSLILIDEDKDNLEVVAGNLNAKFYIDGPEVLKEYYGPTFIVNEFNRVYSIEV